MSDKQVYKNTVALSAQINLSFNLTIIKPKSNISFYYGLIFSKESDPAFWG